MQFKQLSGEQYCCCNNVPIYFGEKQEWYAVCLQCKRKNGPHKNATDAKKEWNRQLKILHKQWREQPTPQHKGGEG